MKNTIWIFASVLLVACTPAQNDAFISTLDATRYPSPTVATQTPWVVTATPSPTPTGICTEDYRLGIDPRAPQLWRLVEDAPECAGWYITVSADVMMNMYFDGDKFCESVEYWISPDPFFKRSSYFEFLHGDALSVWEPGNGIHGAFISVGGDYLVEGSCEVYEKPGYFADSHQVHYFERYQETYDLQFYLDNITVFLLNYLPEEDARKFEKHMLCNGWENVLHTMGGGVSRCYQWTPLWRWIYEDFSPSSGMPIEGPEWISFPMTAWSEAEGFYCERACNPPTQTNPVPPHEEWKEYIFQD